MTGLSTIIRGNISDAYGRDLTASEWGSWESAWSLVTSSAKHENPGLNLGTYLNHRHANRQPVTPGGWIRWFQRDEREQAAGAIKPATPSAEVPWWNRPGKLPWEG